MRARVWAAVLVALGTAGIVLAGAALLGWRFVAGTFVGVLVERVHTWTGDVYAAERARRS